MSRPTLARAGVAITLAVAALAPANASAADGTAATSFGTAQRQLLKGDRYQIECSEMTATPDASFVVMFVLVSTHGYVGGGQGWAQFSPDQPRITITAAEEEFQTTLPADVFGVEDPPAYAAESRGSYRLVVAWASWDTPFDCAVTVNGFPVPPTTLDGDDAMQARLNDFKDGASVDAEVAGVGTLLTHEREVDGFVFNWFYASGSADSEGPAGEDGGDARTFWAGPSSGTWSWWMNAGYSISGSARAFLMEVPA